MGSIISHERSWRIGQLLQQWPDMKGVVNLLIRRVKSDEFIAVGPLMPLRMLMAKP